MKAATRDALVMTLGHIGVCETALGTVETNLGRFDAELESLATEALRAVQLLRKALASKAGV